MGAQPGLFGEPPAPPPAARPRTIPEIRERLKDLAKVHSLPELADLADETKRRPAGRQAPPCSRAITDELADQVRAYAAENPTAPLNAIGLRFGINQGRVSEILFGKRGE